MEQVDILLPPKFNKSDIVKSRTQAIADGDWIGSFNLWVVKDSSGPAMVYQQRSQNSTLLPSKLDVTVGGHYQTGERMSEGLREVREEIGKDYEFSQLTPLGRKMFVAPDVQNNMRHNIVDVFILKDNSPLTTYKLQELEVSGIFECPISELLKTHLKKDYSFIAKGYDVHGKETEIKVIKESFPYNWDNYHLKMTYIARAFLEGKKGLLY